MVLLTTFHLLKRFFSFFGSFFLFFLKKEKKGTKNTNIKKLRSAKTRRNLYMRAKHSLPTMRNIPNYFLKFSSLFLNLSTRPPASTNFCLPVKKGWHLEQTSTLISLPLVDLVTTVSPHAHQWVGLKNNFLDCPTYFFEPELCGEP